MSSPLRVLSSIARVFDTVLIKRNSTGLTNTVTWDPHSLFIHGQRIFILSAEFHPWRLPNPNLWSDIFQKIRANGFNTVSFYVNWALHYPTPDTNGAAGDFQEGTYRDIQRFIDEAKNAGLWLIARPGPYINAETSGGGFPGWVGNIAGSLRTDNSNYTEAWTPYMTAISQLIAKNQITSGGPIILVQAENEFSAGSDRSPYMQAIIDLYRANGVVVPITENDQHGGAAGNFSPDLPGIGRVNIYWFSQCITRTTKRLLRAILSVSQNSAEAGYSDGQVQPAGGPDMNFTLPISQGLHTCANGHDNDTSSVAFGGTNWGQTAEPTVYTSYDYGAGRILSRLRSSGVSEIFSGINENRVAGPKMNEMRLQGLFLRVSRDLLSATLIANGTNYTSSSLIHTAELRNLDTGTGFYIIRHNSSPSTENTTTQLNVSTSVGQIMVPKEGVITIAGRESKILVTDYVFGISAARILYTTTEILTWTTWDNRDLLILYAPSGQIGETTLTFSSPPRISVSSGSGVSYSVVGNAVTLNYGLGSPEYVFLDLPGSTVEIILMDKGTASQWHAPVIPSQGTFGNYFSIGMNQSILVSGPYLIRTAEISGNILSLAGDLNGTTSVEAFAPLNINTIKWNGQVQHVKKTSHGSFKFSAAAVNNVTLPSFKTWKVCGSLPEISPDYDDSSFAIANMTTTNYTDLPPLSGEYVLYSQQYGFYGGNLIYRGRFITTGNETAVNLTVQGGFAFGYSAFLNGVFLGSSQGSPTVSMTADVWQFPNNSLREGENILTVIQDHMGIVESSTNGGKEPRGIRGVTLIGGGSFTSWKMQGNQGGAVSAPDTFRGYLNEGGLYAERIGAHLPGFPDDTWPEGTPLSGGGVQGAGVNFFRTTFNLDLPEGCDVPIRLSITPSDIASNFRVQIYLNGWQVGKYINNFGPQTVFVLPAGILWKNSENTLALSLWSLDPDGAFIAGLELIADGVFSTALDIRDYTDAPNFVAQRPLRPLGTALTHLNFVYRYRAWLMSSPYLNSPLSAPRPSSRTSSRNSIRSIGRAASPIVTMQDDNVTIRTQMSTLKHTIRQQQAQLHNLENTLLRGPRPLPPGIFNSPPLTPEELDAAYPTPHTSIASSGSMSPSAAAKSLRRTSFEVLQTLAGPDSNLPLPRREHRSASFGEENGVNEIREGIPIPSPSKRTQSPTRTLSRIPVSSVGEFGWNARALAEENGDAHLNISASSYMSISPNRRASFTPGNTTKVLADLQAGVLNARNALENTKAQLRQSQRQVSQLTRQTEDLKEVRERLRLENEGLNNVVARKERLLQEVLERARKAEAEVVTLKAQLKTETTTSKKSIREMETALAESTARSQKSEREYIILRDSLKGLVESFKTDHERLREEMRKREERLRKEAEEVSKKYKRLVEEVRKQQKAGGGGIGEVAKLKQESQEIRKELGERLEAKVDSLRDEVEQAAKHNEEAVKTAKNLSEELAHLRRLMRMSASASDSMSSTPIPASDPGNIPP
ncbi:hypothetical protein NM688_g2283 [Phlebia brevispora]|uniref:Uncharacterized protein n=1 Tax=Phlebia brevispora TaxID=194682 RepID=A0ACC1T964_9APHY|nr:hypothetical protein NM688_g2283 [Phlebia brevispora]